MKATLELPDDLLRAIKVRAAESNRRLKDLIEELLREGLARRSGLSRAARKRVRVPLVRCAHRARPDDEMTPERVAQILLEQESGHRRPSVR